MKKFILFFIVTAFGLLLAKTGQTAVWQSPSSGPYKAGNCTLVSTKAEADATHVYTLNPDNTYRINTAYLNYWGRNARCDELQFHVDHNTTLSRLGSWLKSVAIGWYKNIGTTHFNNQTISTTRHEWFLVQNGVVRRIPDWLTGLSFGLLINDRLDIPYTLANDFYSLIKLGSPLNFNEGAYATKIRAIWKNGDTNYSTLPSKMVDEINYFTKESSLNEGDVFNKCTFVYPGFYPGNPYDALLDWTWMLHNPGCL